MKQAIATTGAALALSTLLFGSPITQAGPITVSKTFEEFGTRLLDLDGAIGSFDWSFTGLALSSTPLTLVFDWVRMDFDFGGEQVDVTAEGNVIGTFGDQPGSCVEDNGFFDDCTGSESFNIAADAINDGTLLLSLASSGVNSSGGPPNSAFGSITATLSYEAVPVPATLALMGLGLAGLGWKRRKQA